MNANMPWLVWVVVFGADAAVLVLVPAAARRGGASRGGAVALGAVLAAWLLGVGALAARGAFLSGAGEIPGIGIPIAVSLAIGGAVILLSRRVREVLRRVPQTWLIGMQTVRLVGLVFVYLLARGTLPAQFALPAGWGDFAVGITAPVVAWGFARGRRWARPAAVAWNLAGIADLVVAVGMGALTAAAPSLFAAGPSTNPMAILPLSAIPTFGVPLFILLHAASLLALRASGATRVASVGATGRAGAAGLAV
jgi:hypothetical protein